MCEITNKKMQCVVCQSKCSGHKCSLFRCEECTHAVCNELDLDTFVGMDKDLKDNNVEANRMILDSSTFQD